MPGFETVADTSETLRVVLEQGVNTLLAPPLVVVHDLQGNISTSPALLTLFLVEIVEDPSARNRPSVHRPAPPDISISKPPMALLLRYLITPWSGDGATDHLILGRVLQVLYDGAVIRGPQLQGSLAGTSEEIKITLAPLTLEDHTRVWYAVQKPYRLSLLYEVRVMNINTEISRQARPVRQREIARADPEGRF